MSDCDSCASRGGCPSASDNGSCSPDEQVENVSRNQSLFEKLPPSEGSQIKHVLAVASGKGGVGKSLVTSLLAVQLQRLGLKVGILDADMTGPSIPHAFGVQDQMAEALGERLIKPVTTASGIQLTSINVMLDDPTAPVVWRGPVIASVVKQFYQEVLWESLDVLIVDMPPGTGDVPLTVFQSLPVSGLVMVATPQDLVTLIVKKAKRMADTMEVPLLGLIENMSYFVCPDCSEKHYIFGKGKSAAAAEDMHIPLLAELPLDETLTQLVDAGKIEELPGLVLADAAFKIWLSMEHLSQLRSSNSSDAG